MPHSLWKDRPLPSRPLLARYPCLPLVTLLTACLQGFLKGQNDWSRPSALLEVHRQLCVQTPYKPFEVKVCLLVFWPVVSNDEQVSICCASEMGLSIMCRCLFLFFEASTQFNVFLAEVTCHKLLHLVVSSAFFQRHPMVFLYPKTYRGYERPHDGGDLKGKMM